ncbi:MAG: hypothetical protein Q7Q71_05545 [Verrucomicrobiota bacterium JB023]|nr:hypothetical protein [Verrucomicrobiota bacterium JB023]
MRLPLHLSQLAFIITLHLTLGLGASPFAATGGLTVSLPNPGENVRRDSLLAVDSGGNHHFVTLTQISGQTLDTLLYSRETDGATILLNALPSAFTQRLEATITTSTGQVLLLTSSSYSNGNTLETGCVLHHLNSSSPSQPTFAFSSSGQPSARMAPLEDGNVLVVSRTSSQVIVGRLLAPSFTYEELGRFSAPGMQEFSKLSLFAEPDQTVHLAATTHEELAADNFHSRLLYRSFDPENLAPSQAWQTVTSGLASSPSTEVGASQSLTFDTEPVILFHNEITSQLQSARKAEGGWELNTLEDFASIGRIHLACDELGRLSATWDSLGSGSIRCATFGRSGWTTPSLLASGNFASFVVDTGGYLHYSTQTSVSIPGEDPVEFYQTLRPRDLTDDDGDGLPFVLEELLGSSPNEANHDAIEAGLTSAQNAFLSFLVPSDLAPVGTSESYFYSPGLDIFLTLEISRDLTFWRRADPEIETELFAITGRPSVLVSTLRDNAQEAPRGFLRLKAVRNR